MADNETIADIIRKIRAEADSIEASVRGSLKVEEGLNGMPFTESDLEPALDLVMTKRKKADRLEAAWKREKATTEKSSTVGDAAKLRVALLRCDAIAQLPEVRNEQSIKDMRNIIRHALSAPPRNCNRFGTFAQAKAEWWKTEVLPRVEGVVGGEEPPFEEWLFLPATEQKGENNANK